MWSVQAVFQGLVLAVLQCQGVLIRRTKIMKKQITVEGHSCDACVAQWNLRHNA